MRVEYLFRMTDLTSYASITNLQGNSILNILIQLSSWNSITEPEVLLEV